MGIYITEAKLLRVAKGGHSMILQGIVSHQALMIRYGIDNETRIAMFLGQVAHETQGLTRLEENLYYTTARRLMQVWPTRFKSAGYAQQFTRNPQKLANKVYGGRLGNTGPNDGWLYRGSSCKMTTGKYNYGRVEKYTGLPVVENPDLLRQFPEALEAACVFWADNNLNRFADAGDIVRLTKAVNGGTHGLKDRRIYTDRAEDIAWTQPLDILPEAPRPRLRGAEVLRMGSRGSLVRRAQGLLVAHGIELDIDGKFGGGTDDAVREFQEQQGLMVDGVIGRKTWAALRNPPAGQPKSGEITAGSRPKASILSAILAIIRRLTNG
jgi:putative chitinase